jgi:hypothetical protein
VSAAAVDVPALERRRVAAGFPAEVWWRLWGMVAAGLAYGTFAVGFGLRALGQLAWRWGAPLRGLGR